MRGLWYFRLREAAAVAMVAGLLIPLLLFYRWVYTAPQGKDHLVEARILGFALRETKLDRRPYARVRYPDGHIEYVRMPRSGRGSHCRRGDTIRLVRNDNGRAVMHRDGCARR